MIVKLYNSIKTYRKKSVLGMLVFLFLCCLSSPEIQAQFIIKENTTFVLLGTESKITISDAKIAINSSIEGLGKIIFTGNQNQTLTLTSDIVVPNIIVDNADYFTLKSKLIVNNNFTVKKGTLRLQKLLIVKGEIFFTSEASIDMFSKRYLIMPTTIKKGNNPFTLVQVEYIVPVLLEDNKKENSQKYISSLDFQQSWAYISNLVKIHQNPPISPPPRMV
tara:strand:- start:146 stop:805 length:660 start_codon:yes stop_codon:yes gene_type:complete